MKRDQSTSLVSLAVLLACVAMVSCLLIPKVARQRGVARSAACNENLRRIGLAIHNYHSAYKRLPHPCGGTTGQSDATGNQRRLSAMVGLLPFLDAQRLWESIANPYTDPTTKQTFPSMGPAPWFDPKVYRPWGEVPSVFQCPDDQEAEPQAPATPQVVFTLDRVSPGGNLGVTTNYVVCYGDETDAEPLPENPTPSDNKRLFGFRGFFQPGRQTRFRDVLDGLSNTIMMSETVASVAPNDRTRIFKVVDLSENPSLCLTAAKPDAPAWDFGRGSRWCDGALPFTGFQTILPPNSPSCTSDKNMFQGAVSASSHHGDGVEILMGDGAVVFISNNIDCGDSTAKTSPGRRSPHGLWGALGTRASKENIDQLGNASAQRASPRSPSRPRTKPAERYERWTHQSGTPQLDAVLVRIIDEETVELKDRYGVLHRVPLNTLKDEDIFRAVSRELEKELRPQF